MVKRMFGLGIAILFAAFTSALAAALGLPVAFFDISYLCLNALLAYSYFQTTRQNERRLLLVCIVILSFWIALSVGSYYQPKYNSDLNSERLVAQGILNSGHLDLSGPTPKQVYYSTFPGLEMTGAILALVADASLYTFIGHGSLLFGLLAVVLLYAFYRALAERGGFAQPSEFANKTVLIATWSSSFLAFEALTIHQTLDLVFFSAAFLLLALGRINKETLVLFSLTTVAMIISHNLTPVVFLVFLIVYATTTRLLGRYHVRPLVSINRWYFGLFAAALGLFAFISRTPILLVENAFSALTATTAPTALLHAATPSGTKPAWVEALIVMGLASFVIVSSVGFFQIMKSREPRLLPLIPLALSGGVIFILLFLSPFAADPNSPGVQSRGFIYLYLFGAPLFVTSTMLIKQKIREPRGRMAVEGILVLTLFLTLSVTVFYGLNASFYDNSSPIAYNDQRLGYPQMYAANTFVLKLHYPNGNTILAVELSYAMASGIPSLNIQPLSAFASSHGNFTGLLRYECNHAFILRRDIVAVPDPGYTISQGDYNNVLRSDVIFSDGEPFVAWTVCQ